MARFLRIPVGPSTTSTWTCVAANGNTVVAVADSGTYRVARSLDGGTTWAFLDLGATFNKSWSHVTNIGNLFVAVASAGGTNHIMRSADGGATWSLATTALTVAFNCVATDGTRFVAVGTGTATHKSTDGLTWTAIGAAPNSLNYTSVVWSSTHWVACADNGAAATNFITGDAADITTWTAQAGGLAGTWVEIVKGPTALWAVTSTGGTAGAATITLNGVTYTANNGLASGNYAAAYTDGTTMVVLSQFGAPSSRITTSTDGAAFTVRTIPNIGQMWSAATSISTGNFVVVSRSGGITGNVLKSASGVTTWNSVNLSYSLTQETNCPIYLNIENFITMRPVAQNQIQLQLDSANAAADTATLTFGSDATGATHELIMDAIIDANSAAGAPSAVIDVPSLFDGRFIDFNQTILS